MSTRRDGQGQRRRFAVESLERREVLTAGSETFTGPTLTALLTEAKHGRNTAPAVIDKMVAALETQLKSGPLADVESGAVNGNGFITEAQNLETSFENDIINQQIGPAFPKLAINQLLRLQGQSVVDSLIAENQQLTVGLNATSSFQATIGSLTAGPIQAIGTPSSVLTGISQTFRTELNLLSNDLGNGKLTLEQLTTTLEAEAEAYRGQVHAALQVADPAISGQADHRINNLEASINAIDAADPSSPSPQVAKTIQSFVNSILDTTGLFGSKGAFSKAPKNVTRHPLASLGQIPSAITNVSGTTGSDGTASLTAKLTSNNGSPIMGQPVTFVLDGGFAGVAFTNFVGVATLNEVATTDSVGLDTNGVLARFASNTNFLPSYSTGTLTVNTSGTSVSNVSGIGLYGGTDSLVATLTGGSGRQPIAGQTLTFSLDNTTVGSAVTNSSGVAVLNGVTTADSAGTDTGGIIVRFAGTNTLAGASGQGNLTISQAGTGLSAVAGTAGVGGTATLTATLTSKVTNQGAANESVSFTLDGKSVGSATTNASGVATLTGVATTDAVGTDTGGIVASFAGDTNYTAASNATGNLVVSKNDTSLTDVNGTASLGGTATLNASLTATATGATLAGKPINFTLDGKSVGSAVTNSVGVAALSDVATTDAAGIDTNGIVASFAGDSSDAPSNLVGNFVVNKAGTALTGASGTAAVGGTATLTAKLTSSVTSAPIAGETLKFNLNGTAVGSAVTNSSGIATLSGVAQSNAAGTDSGGVVVNFAGDSSYASSVATGNLVVSANPTTLASVAGTASFGGTAVLSATLTSTTGNQGIGGKTITFKLDGTTVGTATTNVSGVATLAGVTTADAVGTDSAGIAATFAGDTTDGSSSGSGNLVVSKAATAVGSVAGTAIAGGSATLVATLTSTVTNLGLLNQTVSFKLDGTSVGTAVTNANGVATLSGVPTTDAAGTDTGGVVVNYAGNADYTTSQGTGNLVVSPGT